MDRRDVLDEAVRCLALSTGPILDRVVATGEILTSGLRGADFPDREDRELYERIELAVTALRNARDAPSYGSRISAATAEGAAADILDLRDTLMGRAIRDARGEQPTPAAKSVAHRTRWFFTDR